MFILALSGISLYFAVSKYHVSLWYILAGGILLGLIFGKVFCRWMCPMGLIMELLMGMNANGKSMQMYQYHKLGCPIAWISGWLNKFSIFKIKLKTDTCKTCGLCDKECYIVTAEPEKFSLYKPEMQHPGKSYVCSRCLKCVASCPNGSLGFRV